VRREENPLGRPSWRKCEVCGDGHADVDGGRLRCDKHKDTATLAGFAREMRYMMEYAAGTDTGVACSLFTRADLFKLLDLVDKETRKP